MLVEPRAGNPDTWDGKRWRSPTERFRLRPRHALNGKSIPSPHRPPRPPFPNRLRMLRIMTPSIQPQPTTKSRLAHKQLLRRPLNERNQPPMNLLLFPKHLRDRQTLFPFRHQPVECMDSAIANGISRRSTTLHNKWQMLERLLLPRSNVRNDIPHRPITNPPHPLITPPRPTPRQRLPERHPGLIQLFQQSRSIHLPTSLAHHEK